MVNLHSQPLNTWVDLTVDAKSAVLFDPLTGKSGIALTRINNGKFQTYLQLNSGESLILQTYLSKKIAGKACSIPGAVLRTKLWRESELTFLPPQNGPGHIS
jgi:hypothetical protein